MTADFGKITFIVNPNAAMGAAGRDWPGIRDLARDRLGRFRSLITSSEGEATKFTRDALRGGTELIVCVGGDGTFNEIVNGFVEKDLPVRRRAKLAFIPRGTGCDFHRSIKTPNDLKRMLTLIMKSRSRFVDLGRMKYMDHHGRQEERYFHNAVSFGLGGEVVHTVNRSSKKLGGFLPFIRATLITLLTYNKKMIVLKVDDDTEQILSSWHIAVANGQYQGGGMKIAPEARMDDGLFHVTVVGNLSLPGILIHLPKLYTGRIFEVDKVLSFKGKRVEARSTQRVLLDMDGEQPGTIPVTVEIVPNILQIIAPDNRERAPLFF